LWLLLCTDATAAAVFQTTPGGARYQDLRTGTGATVGPGDVVTMHFVGWLDADGGRGKEIYNSRRAARPVSFVVGTDGVMPGWNEGVIGMKPGGRRLLMLPPALGYGGRGVEGIIPPGSGLMFVIDLIDVEAAGDP
jgi:peptidylprolyl isomerase